MIKQYNIAVMGANGYVGKELIGLVQKHPYLQLVDECHLQDIIKTTSHIDLVFLATPPAVSSEVTLALSNTGINIIDLSGAFRLSEAEFIEWYHQPHGCPMLIKQACYGLSPWVTSQSKFQLIANPGCYATAALMALLPVLEANIIEKHHIIIDAKSGVSGSGKQVNPNLMFCEIANNFYPYRIGKHQHIPEIEKVLSDIGGKKVDVTLTTSILPIVRGLSMTIYLEAASSFSSDDEIAAIILSAYQNAYGAYPLVHYKEVGKSAEDELSVLALKHVIHTPYCHIGFFVKKGQITLFSSIDNLLKGAASQAIENLNAMYQLPLQTGLVPFPLKEAS